MFRSAERPARVRRGADGIAVVQSGTFGTGTGTVAGALADAIYDATGKRIRDLPITLDETPNARPRPSVGRRLVPREVRVVGSVFGYPGRVRHRPGTSSREVGSRGGVLGSHAPIRIVDQVVAGFFDRGHRWLLSLAVVVASVAAAR